MDLVCELAKAFPIRPKADRLLLPIRVVLKRFNDHEKVHNGIQFMQANREKFEFIDCREDNEWMAGRAAGSRHLGKGIIERDIEGAVPDPDTKVVIYCGGGFRSALAGDALKRMGYSNVLSMAGGIKAWRDARLPEDRES